MRTTIHLIALTACLAFSAQAYGVELVHHGQPVGGKWQRWADQARVPTAPLKVPLTTNWRVSCSDGQTALGCTDWLYGDDMRPEIEIATCNPPPHVTILCDPNLQGTLYHELGHVWDSAVMTDAQRIQFMAIWNIKPHGPINLDWYRQPHGRLAPPDEWFAEAYRICATFPNMWAASHDWPDYFFPGADTAYSRAQMRDSCALIRGVPAPPLPPSVFTATPSQF